MTSSVIRSRNCRIGIILAVGGLCQASVGQTSSPMHIGNEQTPTYEVATIKPVKDGEGFTLPLRTYILSAFGMSPNASPQLIGPDWISKASYEIHGKPSDSMREAMDKMTPTEKSSETQLMMQALLAERFKMKYHIEMRDMGVYELVPAKGGVRLKEDADRTKARAQVASGQIKVMAVTIPIFIGVLTNVPELEGRPVIDKTGLAGAYDFSLTWSPVRGDAANAPSQSSQTDAPSLFTALKEQLGLRLVASKAPAKVIVIDHIEPPSPN